MKKLLLSLIVLGSFSSFAADCGTKESYNFAVETLSELENLDGENIIIKHNMLTKVQAYVTRLELEKVYTQDIVDSKVAEICGMRD